VIRTERSLVLRRRLADALDRAPHRHRVHVDAEHVARKVGRQRIRRDRAEERQQARAPATHAPGFAL
jgi:hypothetical protein